MLGWIKKKIEKSACEKQVDTIWKAMGVSQDLREVNDRGTLRSFSVERDMGELNGFEYDVNLVRTKESIFIIKKQNGEPVPAALSISKEDLQKVPSEVEDGVFVYLIVKAKYSGLEDEIHSCFITRNGDLYGSQRAFWWSLARSTLNGVFLKINNTRMTDKAFAQVRSAANGMWQSALENDGSINYMRDKMVLLRDKHLGVFSQMKEKFEGNPSVQFGIDITSAMVLATQSEDRMLESIAFERLKQFIWEPGQEPIEFLNSQNLE